VTRATVEAGGVALAYDERAEGPAVVFVHGTATARTVWRETIEALGDGVHTVAYDRRAYGDSGAPEPYGGTTVGEQADDLAELIETLGLAPAVVCGHELGALACLDLIARHRQLVAAAVLIEPPLLWLTPAGTDAVGDLREAVATGAREQGAAGAVRAFLESAGGPEVTALLGPERTEAALADPRAFAADLAAAASWPASRREMRALDVPLTLITGARSQPVRQEATRALAELLPAALTIESDSGHFAHVERPDEVAEAIRGALKAVSSPGADR
jgi:pimeloyl-ACP methyl ester carboxylesterase